MRKISHSVEQIGSGKKVKKKNFELLTELSKKSTKKDLAKKLGISPRTLRSYYDYMRNDILKTEVSKHARKPPKEFTQKIKRIAKNRKVNLTRNKSNFYTRADKLENLVTEKTYAEVESNFSDVNFFGMLVRVNVVILTRSGNFDNWITLVIPNDLRTRNDINDFITGEVLKFVNARNSILGYEIKETVFNIVSNEYEEGKKDISGSYKTGKSKKTKVRKTKK